MRRWWEDDGLAGGASTRPEPALGPGVVETRASMSRFGELVSRVDERIPGADLPLMSVSQTLGVVRRSVLTDKPARADSLDDYKVCRKGDIVFNKMSIRSGAMGLADEDGLVTYHYEVMRPLQQVDPQYVVYLMKSDWFTSEMIRRERGIGAGGQAGVRTTEVPFTHLRTIQVPTRDLAEQRAIAAYLDQETAEIDAFIADQERLIELLTERRASSIDLAVTGGAGPGGDRLAQPEPGWSAERFVRNVIEVVDYRGATPEKTDDGVLLITARNIKDGWIDYGTSREYVSEGDFAQVMRRGLPQVGDLLFTTEAPLGHVALIDRTDIALAQRVILFRLDRSRLLPQFAVLALTASYFQTQLASLATGSTASGIKASKLSQLFVLRPSLAEQARIAHTLSDEIAEMASLVSDAARAIELSRERRAALITAAVMGQIDVRTGQPVAVGAGCQTGPMVGGKAPS